jgi:hypothetical protein
MTPITDTERYAWQFRALALLGELLERATTGHLQPLRWTIDATGQLQGQVYGDGDKREAFTRWRDALGSPDTEREVFGRVTAVWERMAGVRVVLFADLGDGEGEQ